MVRHSAVDAADLLAEQGHFGMVLRYVLRLPLDAEAVIEAAGATRAVVTVEEHSPFGGLGLWSRRWWASIACVRVKCLLLA